MVGERAERVGERAENIMERAKRVGERAEERAESVVEIKGQDDGGKSRKCRGKE